MAKPLRRFIKNEGGGARICHQARQLIEALYSIDQITQADLRHGILLGAGQDRPQL